MAPSPSLAGIVRCYWFLDGRPGRDGADPALPDGSPELIFNLGPPIWARVAGTSWRRQPRSMLVGQITGPLSVRPSGGLELVAVRFEAAGAAVIHRPMAAITDRWIDLGGRGALRAEATRRALIRNGAIADRVAVLEQWLDRLRAERRGPDPRVIRAVTAIRASHGMVSVDRLGPELGMTVRGLQRRFAAEVGIGPKLLCRICRFQRVFGAWRGGPSTLARIAAECGYFDQPHLVRDFRDFAGAAPAAFLTSEPEFTALFTGGRPPG